MVPVLVSTCLLGTRCRYDGRAKTYSSILNIPGIIPVPACPDQLGWAPTPRASASLAGGYGRALIMRRANVQKTFWEDLTLAFLLGARYSFKVVQIVSVRYALPKKWDPSCGTQRVCIDGEIQEWLEAIAAMLKCLGIYLMKEDGLKV